MAEIRLAVIYIFRKVRYVLPTTQENKDGPDIDC